MKSAFEFLVVVLFFATYMISKNIILATSVALAAGLIQAAWCWFKYRKLQTMQWLSLVLIVIFGGATIVFKNAHFIMWKPTVLFWLMASALLIAEMMGKNILASTLGKEIAAPKPVWRKLTLAWVAFLVALGVLNLWVAYHFTESQWVSYKLFGSTGLLIAFVVAQTFYLSRYLEQEKEDTL